MKKVMGFALLILTILVVNFVSGTVAVGNKSHEIDFLYDSGDAITGWVNISLNNEPTNSVLKSSFGGTISLIELIEKASNSGFVKNCDTVNCVSGYVGSNPSTSKTISLSENQAVLLGFKITGNARDLISDITDFSFNLTSNNPETEKFPIAIDLLNDGEYEWNSYTPSDNFGNENRGCFGTKTGEAYIANIYYCERMRISRTPQVELGAYIKGTEAGIDFSMTIDSVDGFKHGSCVTSSTAGTGATERVSCSVSELSVNEEADYFVCIKTNSPLDANKYKINLEEDANKCGFSSSDGAYEGSYNYDFDLFARPKKYLGGINFAFNDEELVNSRSYLTNAENYIENYLSDVYNNNCSKGCVIPMKIFSGVSQQITLSNSYSTNPYIIAYVAGISTVTDKFYDVAETPARMSSGFQKLYLKESGFNVPLQSGNQTFSLILNNSAGEKTLFSEKIKVGGVLAVKTLTPRKTGAKYPTTFRVVLNQSMNSSKYGWNFGDGHSENTTIGEVAHTYDTAGTYTLKISLIDKYGVAVSSKQFEITVAPASEIVPEMIDDAEIKIAYIQEEMMYNFSDFEQRAINYTLKLGQIENDIEEMKEASSAASTEEEFEEILGQLLEIHLPSSVAKTTYSDQVVFYPIADNIDLDVLREIGGGDYESGKEAEYKEAILAWSGENINTFMFYDEISAIYPDYQEPFLRTFDITVMSGASESSYIIMRDLQDILFKGDYSQRQEGGYYYIALEGSEQNFVFSTSEEVSFFDLPMFIAPPISELVLNEWTPFTPEGGLKKWIIFSIIILGVLLVVAAVWVALQIWYKRKYESSLFKNRNNLYNLVNFIQNEKHKGAKEREIIEKLKKAGWTAEQIKYALKKHAGKRTGMPELPIGKLLEGKEKKK